VAGAGEPAVRNLHARCDRPRRGRRGRTLGNRSASDPEAGRLAEGFIATSGKGSELYTDELLPAVADGVAKAERADTDVERMIEMKVSFDTDRDRAMADTRLWAALQQAGGGTWGGCVYDVDAIVDRLR